jgi:Leucine-rich repeat (LRR) protein
MIKIRLIASSLAVASILALTSTRVSAEWREDNKGVRYSENNSLVTGWKDIGGKWYYFYDTGYMAHDTYIDGYYVDSSGVWTRNSSGKIDNSSSTTNQDGNSQIVTFADSYLEQLVRLNLNKPTGDLYKNDVEKITKFACQNQNITDLSGIENLINLQTLTVDLSQIKDISPLKELNNLKTLYLRGKQISDISTLNVLTNLQSLDISATAVTDITPLKELTNLQSLSLSNNTISDISALNGLTNLQELDLYNNQINDVNALKGLVNLQYLILSNNQISNIDALKGLTNLKTLYLAGNNVSDSNKQVLQNSIPNTEFVF